MSSYVVGSDKSGNGDTACIEKICQVFRDNGHTAENIGVTPNLESNLKSKGKGNIGVFMVNGICIGTFDSVRRMVEAGGIDFVWFACPQSINPSNDWLSCESCKTRKVGLAPDDSFTPSDRIAELDKKYTVEEYCNQYSQYVGYACGKDCEEVANNILNGGSGSGGGGTTTSSSSDDKPTPMSYLDMIKDLISVWDGDVECKIRQNKMYINKVPTPQPKLWAIESTNIVSGQAKVTDYNSDTINTLNVTYNNGGNSYTIKDEYLINRFSEVEATIEAEKTVTEYGEGETEISNNANATGEDSEWTKIASVLQTYYQSNDWDSFIRRVKDASTRAEIQSIVVGHKKKAGQEYTSHNQIIVQIMKAKGMSI